ncbi:UDP-N-acetylmuramoyl-L-alanyl-D-glutamate--2,6-diaminopimelate ligase [Helicobacter sp. MIT 14-3879]|uniref:UDP-N-acetylmuramoyl-L-alanyl-D-glutamate--2, 6-diaminopimelate ligase n=1 Tax=Helicobacter sp. MIT 14-3879 TaxID=2040649 RepID=UPI000E1F2652|nr:UDP-N-acetylmuramoyl-L-alanyl-D-glutamate--2,6-diaminopimelate ligase [Helicobacter sp. MIT 14-3879]RDU64157.1 UDP-N-acetylmuramoyl-L-alanyl-D-glutamate--2,6-diaminopimelate ligase [Helicobacter sp. MIT 14-3879]
MIINLEDKILTDNTKEIDKNVIFVKTALNERYVSDLANVKIVTPLELKNYLLHTPKIIGITGTNGKTTTASCIYSILLSLGFKVALCGTRGFFINDIRISKKGLTTPTLLELYHNIHIASKHNCDYFIMEVSSHAISQNRIEGLGFSLKILSNIESDHLDFHKTIEEYIRVKNSFFNDDGLKLINKDCNNAIFNVKNAYTYAIENNANLKVDAYSLRGEINAHISWNDFRTKEFSSTTIQSNLIGKYNLYNIISSIASVKLLCSEIPLNKIALALGEFAGVEGRIEVVNKKPLVVVDFAHTPDGMKNVFEAFLGNKIKVLFGAGGDRDKTKRPEMGKIASIYAKKIYLTSDNPRSENPHFILQDIMEGIKDKDKVYVESNRKIALHKALSELECDDILLVLGKGDETYQIIGDKILDFDDRKIIREFYSKH